MSITLGSSDLGYPQYASGDGKVYYGNKLMINKLQYANWSPVSQSILSGFYTSNQDLTGSFNSSGQWLSIQGPYSSSNYNLNPQGTVKNLRYDNPNNVNSVYSTASSYLQPFAANPWLQGEYLAQFWIRPRTNTGNNYIFYKVGPDASTAAVTFYFNSSLDTIYWGMYTSPTPRTYKLVSSSISPTTWNDQWHNIAFQYQDGARRLFIDGALQQEWLGLDENNLYYSDVQYFFGSPSTGSNMDCESIVIYDESSAPSGSSAEMTALVSANYEASKHIFQF